MGYTSLEHGINPQTRICLRGGGNSSTLNTATTGLTLDRAWRHSHKRHPVARPLGRTMGCLLWVICAWMNLAYPWHWNQEQGVANELSHMAVGDMVTHGARAPVIMILVVLMIDAINNLNLNVPLYEPWIWWYCMSVLEAVNPKINSETTKVNVDRMKSKNRRLYSVLFVSFFHKLWLKYRLYIVLWINMPDTFVAIDLDDRLLGHYGNSLP